MWYVTKAQILQDALVMRGKEEPRHIAHCAPALCPPSPWEVEIRRELPEGGAAPVMIIVNGWLQDFPRGEATSNEEALRDRVSEHRFEKNPQKITRLVSVTMKL